MIPIFVDILSIGGLLQNRKVGMTQKEFADYMGVTQGMISKWESREYNFTIRALNEICQKLGLTLSMSMEKPCIKKQLLKAGRDLQYLLNQGYNIKGASTFVGNHYLLSERQRLALVRAISSEESIKMRKNKEVMVIDN